MDTLALTRTGSVATLELARPDVHNAFDARMLEELGSTLDVLEADDEVRVLVLAARGKSFCAGADLAWMRSLAATGAAANGEDALLLAGLFDRIDRFPKPVVGRVHGAALGGGTGLVAACDIPIALESVRFAFTEVRLGMAPAVISPYVVRRIGRAAARELFLTGRKFDAAEACRLGLVSRVEPDVESLDRAVAETVADLLRGAPKAQAACKELARTILDLDRETAKTETAALIARLRAAPEGQEGMLAYLQKRPPVWHPKDPE